MLEINHMGNFPNTERMVWDAQMESWEVVNIITYFRSVLKHYFFLQVWKGPKM